MVNVIPTVAVIVTHNRPELLQRSAAAAARQVDGLIILDNASTPPVDEVELVRTVKWPNSLSTFAVRHVETQPPNLSALWNIGLRMARSWYGPPFFDLWNVAVLCDDAIIPNGWVTTVATTMRDTGAVAGSTHQATPINEPILKTGPDSDIWNRMCGWAFMLAGETGPIADERLRWWWCDTHIDWMARHNGGMVIAPGPVVPNEKPNDYTNTIPELGEQAGRDGATFEQIWGYRPW